MRFYQRKNEHPLTPYAPKWDYCIGTSFIKSIDCNAFSKTILKKEKEIKRIPSSNDGDTGLGPKSTTSKFQHYNVLTWKTPETNALRSNILSHFIEYNNHLGNETPQKLWGQCWVNILRFGQKIKAHTHSYDPWAYVSGHFTVKSKDTFTVYVNPVNQLRSGVWKNPFNDPELIKKKNEVGHLTLFPQYVPHYTTRHYSWTPRITIAFDLTMFPPGKGSWIEL